MKGILDDVIGIEDDLYEEISRTVNEILGENVTERQKQRLFNYLLSRVRQESEKFGNCFEEDYYNYNYQFPYNAFPNLYNQSQFSINLPISQPPMQPLFYSYPYNLPPSPMVLQPPPMPLQMVNPPGSPLSNQGIPLTPQQQFLQPPPGYQFYGQPSVFPQNPNIAFQPSLKTKSHKKDEEKKHKHEHEHHHKHEDKGKKKDSKSDKKHHSKKKSSKPKVYTIQPYCTYSVAGRNYITQKWYHCRTCGLTGSNGMCEYCAKNCHQNHDIYFEGVESGCFCDCPDHDTCKIQAPPGDHECTFETTEGTPVPQPMYHCQDCDIMFDSCICQNCAIKYHQGHTLEPVEDENPTSICYHYKQKHHL